MKLPTIIANVVTSWCDKTNNYIISPHEVEVLSINFNRKTLQVRYSAVIFPKAGNVPKIRTPHIEFSCVDTNDLRRVVEAWFIFYF